MNIQGSGNAIVRNCDMYADGSRAIFCLRSDYGPSWNGDLTVDDVRIYYCKDYKAGGSKNELMILQTYDPDLRTDFDSVRQPDGTYATDGQCKIYLPQNVIINNVNVYKYTYEGYNKETDSLVGMKIVSTNDASVYLYNPFIHTQGNVDISKYGAIDGQQTIV